MIETEVKHNKQKAHDAADCQINERPHNHPDMDCGHYVNSGPGVINGADRKEPREE